MQCTQYMHLRARLERSIMYVMQGRVEKGGWREELELYCQIARTIEEKEKWAPICVRLINEEIDKNIMVGREFF